MRRIFGCMRRKWRKSKVGVLNGYYCKLMQIPTHVMSGWCAANLLPRLSPRQRLMCMIAATIPDLDGLSIFFGQQAYWNWHHRVCHNLPFGILACLILAAISGKTFRLFVLYLALFHLHIETISITNDPAMGRKRPECEAEVRSVSAK